jgi:hypothetical protein
MKTSPVQPALLTLCLALAGSASAGTLIDVDFYDTNSISGVAPTPATMTP